jgi:plasmid stability protein
MSRITIRNLDPAIKQRLRVRAAERGRSMEAEARRIRQAARPQPL